MVTTKCVIRISLLVIWAALLAGLTGILSAIPLKVLRSNVGAFRFWILGSILAATAWIIQLPAIAVVIAAQTILIGVYSELEEREAPIRQAALYAVSLTALLVGSGFYFWTSLFGKNWLGFISSAVQAFLNQASKINADLFSQLKVEDLLAQLPSAVVIFLIVSIALAAIFERPISNLTRSALLRRRQKLTAYSVPDAMIWVFILSLLGTFAKHDVQIFKTVAMNCLNVCVVLFFFQGLAVLGRYFEVFKVSSFWRWMWVLLLAIQLPILLGAVGVVDYWVDFRRLFIKRTTNLKKKRIEE